MAGIEKTVECFDDLGNLAVAAIGIVKTGGFSFGSLPKILQAVAQIGELVKDLPGALPELQDLDSTEAAQVGAAAFIMVKKIVDAVKA